jgi:RNA 3'-terminal phosphate cyclase (ATP)
LQPQHLTSVTAAATVGQAQLQGATLKSSELIFEPGQVSAGTYHFPIGTAGALGLVLHTVYLPLALRGGAPSEVILGGGTHVPASPCFHFLDTTWRPYLRLVGIDISLHMRRPGFYPRGGGIVHGHIQSAVVRPLQVLARRPVSKITGFSAVAGLPTEIATRQARRAASRLAATGLDVNIGEETWVDGPGTVLALILDTEPAPTLFFGLGARGKRAERVADEAVDQVMAYLAAEGAVDPHSADQLVLPLALADGPSQFSVSEVTLHLLTNIEVIGLFVPRRLVCEAEIGASGIVRID